MQVVEVMPVGFGSLRCKDPSESLISQYRVGVAVTRGEEHPGRFVPEGLPDAPGFRESGVGVDEKILVGEIKHPLPRFRPFVLGTPLHPRQGERRETRHRIRP
ncbi:unannotated protein [freshwater metagenome]|uniref:Unannotated protein n=1 Tax=freshwater metagenome TaxID=449393 RepID=A0A6J7D4K9_9ZZZZ